MTADAPPNRKHLAAMLKVFARSGAYFGIPARTELIQYIEICEDTIEQQARAMRADTKDLADSRAVWAENARLVAEIEGWQTCNTAWAVVAKKLIDALDAGQQDDGEAISIIRAALEGTS